MSLSLLPQSRLGGDLGLSNRSPRPGENLLGVPLLLGLRRIGDRLGFTTGAGLLLRPLRLGLSLELPRLNRSPAPGPEGGPPLLFDLRRGAKRPAGT